MSGNFSNLLTTELQSWAEKEHTRINKGGLRPWDAKVSKEFHHLTKSINGLNILLDDDYFMGLNDTIFPAHRDDIYEFWEEKYINEKNINLVIFLEGIGSGKSSKFSILSWLQWFELTTKCDIAEYYRTLPDEITAFISMSRSEVQAKKVVMSKVMARFSTQFNREFFPPNPRKGQEIFIERNLTSIFAGTSSAASSLGYNIFGGAVDEANFLEVQEESARTRGKERYDAAEEMYNHMTGRMKSRFINPYTGLLDGTMFMFSSCRYPDDFLEKMAKQRYALGDDSKIFIVRRSLWEAKPKWYFSHINFHFDIEKKEIVETPTEIEVLKKKVETEQRQQPKPITMEEKYEQQKTRRNEAGWHPPGEEIKSQKVNQV